MITKSFRVTKASAEADIALINQYALTELKPEDVFCFSVVLCDNEVDRDLERFTDEALEALAGMFVGKTGIKDHDWSTDNQVARIYRAEVESTGELTKDGREQKQLVGSVYMLRNEKTEPLIASIEGGITKEVSVGFSARRCSCSICGERMTWLGFCAGDGHEKGKSYDGQTCVGLLEDPLDAYEFSFVAVPAQPRAGVTKEALSGVFEMLKNADLTPHAEQIRELMPAFQAALATVEEQAERRRIIAENKKFISTKG